MVRAARPLNSKFNLHDVLEHWFYVAYPTDLYEIPDSEEAIDKQIQYIYDGLIERRILEMKGLFMAVKREPSTRTSTGKNRKYVSKSKKKTGNKGGGTVDKKKPAVERGGAATDRRVYICQLLTEKKYTDEAIMRMSDGKFKDLDECKQKWVARLRCRLNNGKYPEIKFKGKIERNISK